MTFRSEPKHTLGPWRIDRFDPLRVIIDGQLIASVHDGRFLVPGQAKADACLIAAAPDLLAALREILHYDGGADHALEDPYVMERACAALAKAEGDA